MGIDDPVGASAVHGVGGIWGEFQVENTSVRWNKAHMLNINIRNIIHPGVLAVGLFAQNPYPLDTTGGRSGVLKG